MTKTKRAQTPAKKAPSTSDLTRQVKRLKAENKRLRKQNDRLERDLADLASRNEGLEMANRQLLRDYDHLAGMAVCERMATLETENRRLRDAMREIDRFAVKTGCTVEPSERVTRKREE